jgi:hypothetical protein
LSFIFLDLGALLVLLGIYKIPVYALSGIFSLGGLATLVGGVFLISAVLKIRKQFQSCPRETTIMGSAHFLSLFLALSIGEFALRMLSEPTAHGIRIANITLRPTWTEIVGQSREAIDRVDTRYSYFVFDEELGWSVGKSRATLDGMYASSAEGLRSSTVGVHLGDRQTRFRVALIGDSNAFSLEVPFEDSWGYHLQQGLGNEVQVLNFGVDGYDLGQTYLRFLRDVAPWQPDVVIIVIVRHDLVRATMVYPFIAFGWHGYLVKPRFDVIEDSLVLVNQTLPRLNDILGASSVSDLPNIDYDASYTHTDWTWQFDSGPYLLRLITSVFPRWPAKDSLAVADMMTLNVRLLTETVTAIEERGAQPVVVYLPHRSGDHSLADELLKRSGVENFNVSSCLEKVPEPLRLTPSGHHLSGLANRVLAECFVPALREML